MPLSIRRDPPAGFSQWRKWGNSAPSHGHGGMVLTWRKLSPSALLMVDPRNGARAVIRDTGADAGRYLWSVLAAGEMDPISDGRTDELARARALAEATLLAYAEN